MPGPSLTISSAQVGAVSQQNVQRPVFQGTRTEARQLLVDLANTFVRDDHTIVSGNFRLALNTDGSARVETRRYWHAAANDQANAFIKSLARTAYGDDAANALTAYLGHSGNKLGTHSLVNLVQSWRGQSLEATERDQSVDQAEVKEGVRLSARLLRDHSVLGAAQHERQPATRSDAQGDASNLVGDQPPAPIASAEPSEQDASAHDPSDQNLLRGGSARRLSGQVLDQVPLDARPLSPSQAQTQVQVQEADPRQAPGPIAPPSAAAPQPDDAQSVVAQPPPVPAPSGPPVDLSKIRHPNLYARHQIEFVSTLGSGSFGAAYETKLAGQPGYVLKELSKPIELSLAVFLRDGRAIRHDMLQESMAVYLHSEKNSAWSQDLNVTAPTHFLIRRSKGARVELLTQQQTHALLKQARAIGRTLICEGQVMKKAPGESLGALIKQGTLTVDDQIAIGRSMLRTLRKLAERGFVHRDIKPDNLFYDRQTGTVTFIDTGMLYKIPKPTSQSGQRVATQLMGTPVYVSPHVLSPGARYGANADLHSSAMTLLEIAYPSAIALAQDYLWSTSKNSVDDPARFVRRLEAAVREVREETFAQCQFLFDAAESVFDADVQGTLDINGVRRFRERLYRASPTFRHDEICKPMIEQAIALLEPAPDPATPDGLARLQQAHALVVDVNSKLARRITESDTLIEDLADPLTPAGGARAWLRAASEFPDLWRTRAKTANVLDTVSKLPAFAEQPAMRA